MMLKKPPKDQIESYETPPSGKLFKGTKHNQMMVRPFPHRAPRQERQHDIKGKGAK